MRRTAMLALLAGGWLASPPVLAAQFPVVLSGRVLDSIAGSPIEGAEISLAGLTVFTGPDGEFELHGVAPGSHTLFVEAPSYVPALERIAVQNGLAITVTIRLAPLPVPLEALEVTARQERSVPTLDGEELRERGRTLAQALDGWRGLVMRRREPGSATPVLRGSASDEVLVLLDGVALNDPVTGVANLERVMSSDVERATLYAGAQGARFGSRSLTGVLVLQTRDAQSSRASAFLGSHSTFGTQFGVAPGDDLSLRIAFEGRGDRYPVTLPAARGGGEATRVNAGYSATRFQLRKRWGALLLAARMERERRGLPGTLSNPSAHGTGSYRWDQVQLSGEGRGPDGRSVSGRLVVELVTTAATDSMPPLGLPYADTARVAGVEASGRWGVLSAGGRVDRFWGNAVRQGVFTAARAHLGAARKIGADAEWGAWWVSPAARIDMWTNGGTPAFSLRLDGAVARGPLSATGGLGGSAAPPVIADLIFREGVGVRPNPELRAERVPWELEGSVAWQPSRWRAVRPRVELGGYVGRVSDMVLWAPDFRFVWSPRNFDARRAGLTLDAHVAVPTLGLVAEGTYALSSVRYDRPHGPQVIYRPRDTQHLSLQWVSRCATGRISVRRLGERFPNHGGVGALAPVTAADLSVSIRSGLGRADLDLEIVARDIFDARPAFIAEYPSPGRSLIVEMTWEW